MKEVKPDLKPQQYKKIGERYPLRRNDLILSVTSILIGISAFILSASMKAEVAFFPRLAAGFLILLGVILLFVTLRVHSEQTEQKQKPVVNRQFILQKVIRVALIIVMLVLYYFAISVLGYIIPTFLLIFGVVYILDYKNLKINLLTSLSVSVGLYVIFAKLLQVHFPKGLFF